MPLSVQISSGRDLSRVDDTENIGLVRWTGNRMEGCQVESPIGKDSNKMRGVSPR